MERTSPVSPDSPDQRAYLALGVQVGAHGPHDTFVGREFRPFRRSVPRTPTDGAAPAQLHAYMASAERSVLSEDAYLADSPATCLPGDGNPNRPSVPRSPPHDAVLAQLHVYLTSAERPVPLEDAYLADSPATCLPGDGKPYRPSVLRSPPTDGAAPAQLHAYMASAERSVLSDDVYMADSPAGCLPGDGISPVSSVLRERTPSAGRAQPNHTTSNKGTIYS